MRSRDTILDLRCPVCDWSELCDLVGMRAWLHAIGKLRRATDPEPELVIELFRNSREQFTCEECDAILLIEEPSDDDWLAERKCEACSEPIPAARLAAVPSATMCAACQGTMDRGEAVGEAEYCPHCGGILVLRKAGAGITRYQMRCGDCGR